MTDNLQSNVITVTPDGTIGADFTGTVNAQGITFDASPRGGPIQAAAQIQWIRASDGALLAFVATIDEAPGGLIQITAQDADNVGHSFSLFVVGGENGGAGNNQVSVGGQGAGANRIVLDDIERSSFLQLLSAQQLQLDFGQVTLAWTASNLSATATINHGLARVPQLVLATAFGAPAAGQIPALNTFNYTTAAFSLNGDTRLSGTFSCPVKWIAIG